MKLYLIKREEETVRYDEAAGFVVAADTEGQARLLITGTKGHYGDEGPGVWLDPKMTPCRSIGVATFYGAAAEPGIILRDFRAG